MPPSLQMAPSNLCQLGLSTVRHVWSALEHGPAAEDFSFSGPSPFVSSWWQGLEWGQSRGSALRYHRFYRVLRACMSTPPSTFCGTLDHLPDPVSST